MNNNRRTRQLKRPVFEAQVGVSCIAGGVVSIITSASVFQRPAVILSSSLRSPASSSQPLQAALTRAAQVAQTFVIVGRGRRLARTSHRAELKRLLIAAGHCTRDAGAAGGEMSRTVGDVAAAFLLAPQGGSASVTEHGAVIVVQAALPHGQAV